MERRCGLTVTSARRKRHVRNALTVTHGGTDFIRSSRGYVNAASKRKWLLSLNKWKRDRE
jgi:hypothetical protein